MIRELLLKWGEWMLRKKLVDNRQWLKLNDLIKFIYFSSFCPFFSFFSYLLIIFSLSCQFKVRIQFFTLYLTKALLSLQELIFIFRWPALKLVLRKSLLVAIQLSFLLAFCVKFVLLTHYKPFFFQYLNHSQHNPLKLPWILLLIFQLLLAVWMEEPALKIFSTVDLPGLFLLTYVLCLKFLGPFHPCFEA